MALIFYIFKRFFKYFFLINILSTFLFNFIEFFEKIVRVKIASTGTILHFILLNLLPSFFSNFPLSSWLATCLLLKELAQQNEFEIFQLLNINPTRLFKLFFILGIILSATSFVGKEYISLNLLNETEHFKLEKFKQNSTQIVLNKWLILPDNKLLFFQSVNLKNNIGSNFILIHMSDEFEIQKTIFSKKFEINSKINNIFIENYSIIQSENNNLKEEKNLNLNLPSFFSQLKLNLKIQTLFNVLQSIITQKNLLPYNIWYDLLMQFFKRILFHLQVIIFPLLTLCLFFILPYDNKYKWLLILTPYPLVLSLLALSEVFAYIFLIFIIFVMHKKLEKSY
ncbi:LptF/LptG family permease [Candidatus Babeliales bacterium]|nr:LptF/LptG family permease [Candidatus Babeliales bacterium]